MSRIAKSPIPVPNGVEIKIDGSSVSVKGSKGELAHSFPATVSFSQEGGHVQCAPVGNAKTSWAMAGTARALINNMVLGVNAGFEKKLTLVGVGYRAQVKGKVLNLTLGFSHPVNYPIPEGISIDAPSQTELVVKGINKQQVGQVAAEIRAYRPPEPYKGKGVRYTDEHVVRKDAKKK